MLNVLIVEDEIHLGETLTFYLKGLNYTTFWAKNKQEAKDFFHRETIDLILMDVGLPDGNGISLANEMRLLKKDFFLLFLSAQNNPDTKVQALEVGADDYMTKPFSLKELTWRLEKILKTKKDLTALPEELIFGPLKIWFRRFEVQDAQGALINLSQKECAILELLYKNQGMAIDREKIIEAIWGEDRFPSNRTVDNYIVKLRKWCESDTNKNLEIQSIRGIGYKLIIKN